MRKRKKKSVCFFRPDYHATFAHLDALRDLGWRAEVFTPKDWPDQLLFDRSVRRHRNYWKLRSSIWGIFYVIYAVARFRHFIYYGNPPFNVFKIDRILKTKADNPFSIELWVFRLFRRKVIYLPTGCLDTLPQRKFSLLDNGNVCGNCGIQDRCNDVLNDANFKMIRKYFNFGFSDGSLESSEYPTKVFPWKAIDLELWSPNLEVPADFQLPETSAIRIMHSSFLEKSGRNWMGRNIKGTPHVVAAVERLKSEGHNVEYVFADNLHIADVRFIQAQADIVVEQLIYGWWGSTGVETMALGKPVVCYLRNEWKENFFRNFPEYDSLPIVEADTATIYDVLKQLVLDEKLRERKGRESREFAEQHFSPEINARKLESLLLAE